MSDTTVENFITDLDSLMDNDYSNANKLRWINDLEFSLYQDPYFYTEYRTYYFRRKNNVYQYSLPSGVTWEDVYSLWVDSKQYDKKSQMHYESDYSYWYENSVINIWPIPDENDTEYVSGANEITFKAIEYSSGAGEITFASGTITTTGDSFVTAGFVANMTVEIEGCTDNTGNNISAIITEVSATVLTFDTGTFTAGAEDGVITIKANCIYTSGHDFDGFDAEEIVLVSGCTDETDNNKYARIVAVEDDVLTFAEDTFTAQAESAAVTIQQPTIKMVYRYKPTEKAIGDIATDTLFLPRRFEMVYYYYCYAQIAYLQKEYNDYNNHMAMFNKVIADYAAWLEDRRPMTANNVLYDGWGDSDDNE